MRKWSVKALATDPDDNGRSRKCAKDGHELIITQKMEEPPWLIKMTGGGQRERGREKRARERKKERGRMASLKAYGARAANSTHSSGSRISGLFRLRGRPIKGRDC